MENKNIRCSKIDSMRKRIRDIENEQYQKIKNKTHRKMDGIRK